MYFLIFNFFLRCKKLRGFTLYSLYLQKVTLVPCSVPAAPQSKPSQSNQKKKGKNATPTHTIYDVLSENN